MRFIAPPKEPPPPVSELLLELINAYPFIFYPSLVIVFLAFAAFALTMLDKRRQRRARARADG